MTTQSVTQSCCGFVRIARQQQDSPAAVSEASTPAAPSRIRDGSRRCAPPVRGIPTSDDSSSLIRDGLLAIIGDNRAALCLAHDLARDDDDVTGRDARRAVPPYRAKLGVSSSTRSVDSSTSPDTVDTDDLQLACAHVMSSPAMSSTRRARRFLRFPGFAKMVSKASAWNPAFRSADTVAPSARPQTTRQSGRRCGAFHGARRLRPQLFQRRSPSGQASAIPHRVSTHDWRDANDGSRCHLHGRSDSRTAKIGAMDTTGFDGGSTTTSALMMASMTPGPGAAVSPLPTYKLARWDRRTVSHPPLLEVKRGRLSGIRILNNDVGFDAVVAHGNGVTQGVASVHTAGPSLMTSCSPHRVLGCGRDASRYRDHRGRTTRFGPVVSQLLKHREGIRFDPNHVRRPRLRRACTSHCRGRGRFADRTAGCRLPCCRRR